MKEYKEDYDVYLKKLIKKHKLEDKVIFLGSLTAEQMKERMLKSNVFILSSEIKCNCFKKIITLLFELYAFLMKL